LDLAEAIDAARCAYDTATWPYLSFTHRGDYLSQLADLILDHKSLFTYLEAFDGGIPRANSRADVDAAVDILIQHAFSHRERPPYAGPQYTRAASFTFQQGHAVATHLHSPTSTPIPLSPISPTAGTGISNITKDGAGLSRSPARGTGVILAVVSSVGPYLSSLADLLAPAVISGDSVIFLVSEEAPLVALEVAGLLVRASFPPGVVQIMSGTLGKDGMRLAEFIGHPNVNKVSIQ
jgi:acyl-CoA reductase-like NAD-dependent aldehyde dehydrogenase